MMEPTDYTRCWAFLNEQNDERFRELVERVGSGKPLNDSDARFFEQMVSARDHAITTDPLTRIPNIIDFGAHLQDAITHAQRKGYSNDTYIGFADLDNLKEYNDSIGHADGDKVLRCTAAYLRDNIKQGDRVARYGGDEFALLLYRANNQVETPVSQRLSEVAQAFPGVLRDERLDMEGIIGLSIGLSVLQPGMNAWTILRRADDAMYHSKYLMKVEGRREATVWTPEIDYEDVRRKLQQFLPTRETRSRRPERKYNIGRLLQRLLPAAHARRYAARDR